MNETHTLNGIKYVSRLITEEENTLIDKLRNDELGCLICESRKVINANRFDVSVYKDDMQVEYVHPGGVVENMFIQISFCPFCGKPL